jgi:S-DNA-T family DNA segregation ATPase FtsK/SpoIIIE
MVELELYNGIPHLLAPVITSPEEAIAVLEWVSNEMDKRYKILSEFSVRNIIDYNKEIKKINAAASQNEKMEHFPYIVVVIDEFANLMLRLPKETEKVISRIAAMARAVGIHLVVATQRPSVDVVTGIIKANFPSRIAFRVSSQTDARTILDKSGAEKLLGKGDMLFMTPNFTDLLRIQSPFVSNEDVESVVKELKRNGTAEYIIDLENLTENVTESRDESMMSDYRQDPIFVESLKAAVDNGEVSASYLQRRFRIGYNRASRIIEAMEKMKILGPATGASKPREVIIGQEDLVHLIN